MTSRPRHAEVRPRFDSGYTDRQLDLIFRSLAWGTSVGPLEYLLSALVIGLCDGDMIPLSEGGTVMLHTPRPEIDRRVAFVRAAMNNGATFQQAVCAIPGD